MCSYPFIVNFFQKGELILSLKVLKPLLSVVMFTMLIFSLSFKDCKCFLYPYFGYFFYYRTLSLCPFKLLANTLFISLSHLCLVLCFSFALRQAKT